MILGTREAYLNYIPFTSIAMEEQPYYFRLPNAELAAMLKASLIRSGQTHPVTLLEVSPEKFLVLDGHRRCEAIRSVRNGGGDWEKVLAQVVPYETFSLPERFRTLRDKNMRGDNPYGLPEQGQFYRDFVALGMSINEIARECSIPFSVVEDTIDLSRVHPRLAVHLNRVSIDPAFALMLHHRFMGWLQSPHAAQAEDTARKLLAHAEREKLTMKSWRFLLDFYWGGDQPFLASPC